MKLSSKNILIMVLLVLISTSVSFSQQNQLKKADKEFDRYAYIDAREIYLKVVEDGYASAEIYKKLGDTYYWNSDYRNASKWYVRLVDQFPSQTEAPYYLRAAQSLKSVGNYEDSDKMMESYIAITGDNLVSKNYEKNKDYLSQIAFKSKDYELEKTAISTASSDFGSAYYLGRVVFASSEGSTGDKTYAWTDAPYLDLFVADRDSLGKLTNKERLSDVINTKYHESSAVFTKDGNTIYFTRNNFIKGRAGKDKDKTVRLKLYRAVKGDDGNWADVSELPFNSEEYSTAHPALSLDEERLYFSSDMPGTYGMSDLWSVDILGENTYSEPVNLGEMINTETRESFPFISEKGNLYFSTDGRPGLGGYDIFSGPITSDGVVGDIVNIGVPANSNQDDFGIIIEEDKNLGYLSSNRGGTPGSSGDDVYRIQFAKCQVTVAGTVIDSKTKLPIAMALVKLLDFENNELAEAIADTDGKYIFPETVDCKRQFTVRASKEDYDSNEIIIQPQEESIVLDITIPLTKEECTIYDLGCKLLEPIYFDFDKSFIRADAEIEISKILAAMKLYPDLLIHIESHTDSRGNDQYNESLSDRRAQSTRDWLIANGIDATRLSAKGYGEYQLLNQCSDGVECTEEEHQLNRRSMFIIKNNNSRFDNSANERK